MARTYLDYNATAPLEPAAKAAADSALALTGNASSVHAEGRAARAMIEEARGAVMALAGVEGAAVTFTGGGTEANVLALAPGVGRAGETGRVSRLFVSAVEHLSVLKGHRFPEGKVSLVPVDGNGVVDLAALEAMLADLGAGESALVSVMLANNETGVIQPVAEVAALVRAHGGLTHCDAVQAAGRVPLDFDALGVDMMTLSAHKIGGLQGVGALIAREGVMPVALVGGGGQEKGLRAGTENLPGIAAFGAAARAALAGLEDMARIATLRGRLEAEIARVSPAAHIAGSAVERLPNTACIVLPGARAETLVIALDLAGFAVSSGSACSSGKVTPSHVLAAMGLDEKAARAAVRVSLGRGSEEEDIGRFMDAWAGVAAKARASAA